MFCKCWNLGHMQMPQLRLLQRSPFLVSSPTSCSLLSTCKRRTRLGKLHCSNKEVENAQLEIGSAEWLAKATPLQVLGLQYEDSFSLAQEDIKAAFRAKVKEFHPDVYKGPGNSSTIVQRVIQAYEIIMRRISQGQYIQRESSDPFEEPECEALDIFVNELLCIGKGCSYSCVTRAPHAFAYAPDTSCARAIAQEQGENYQVQLAVGQCPTNCIYYVTPAQRVILEELLARALKDTYYSSEASLLESLIARANFENNRYQGRPKRNAKYTTEWVDWF